MSIIKSLKPVPNLICLTESNLKKKKRLNLGGYYCFNRNRQVGNMGGVATCVAEEEECDVLKVSEGDDTNEYLITRHTNFKTPINIINLYRAVE